MEKKPFYHFWPGSYALTIGSWSCNSACAWCQNYHISKVPPDPSRSEYLTPERFVELVERYGCNATSISFNEPTLSFEWSIDVFELARARGFRNTFVTNAYMSLEALKRLRDAGLDALCIDVKGDAEAVRKYCGLDVEVVWRNVREARRSGMHVEIVNLIIPGVNDREGQIRELVERHLREAGREAPLHFTAYYPAYRFDAPPTPVSRLERARKLAVSEGVCFAYIGNVPGHPYENTYCPDCGELLIERYGFEVLKNKIESGKCPKCKVKIPIVGKIRAR
jgi:pyruvate formate lyase activating enzyme